MNNLFFSISSSFPTVSTTFTDNNLSIKPKALERFFQNDNLRELFIENLISIQSIDHKAFNFVDISKGSSLDFNRKPIVDMRYEHQILEINNDIVNANVIYYFPMRIKWTFGDQTLSTLVFNNSQIMSNKLILLRTTLSANKHKSETIEKCMTRLKSNADTNSFELAGINTIELHAKNFVYSKHKPHFAYDDKLQYIGKFRSLELEDFLHPNFLIIQEGTEFYARGSHTLAKWGLPFVTDRIILMINSIKLILNLMHCSKSLYHYLKQVQLFKQFIKLLMIWEQINTGENKKTLDHRKHIKLVQGISGKDIMTFIDWKLEQIGTAYEGSFYRYLIFQNYQRIEKYLNASTVMTTNPKQMLNIKNRLLKLTEQYKKTSQQVEEYRKMIISCSSPASKLLRLITRGKDFGFTEAEKLEFSNVLHIYCSSLNSEISDYLINQSF